MAPTIREKYAVDYFPGLSPDGQPALVLIAKRGYTVDEAESIAVPVDEPPVPSPEDKLYEGNDCMKSSPKVEGDFVPFKPRTDIVVLGTAYAPMRGAASRFDVSVRVGDYEKALHIVGPRRCLWQPPRIEKRGKVRVVVPLPPKFTDPEPVSKVPIRYENAFGGVSVIIPPDEEEMRRLIREAEEKEAAEQAASAQTKEEKERAAEQEKRFEEFVGGSSDAGQAAVPAAPVARERRGRPDALDEPTPDADVDAAPSGGSTQILSTNELLRNESTGGSAPRQAEPLEATAASLGMGDDTLSIDLAGDVVVDDAALDVEAIDRREAELLPDALELRKGDHAEDDDGWVEREREKKQEIDKASGRTKRPPLPEGLTKVHYPTNPVGRGYAATNDRRLVDGLELPLVEDPMRPIQPEDVVRSPGELLDKALPAAGFGAVGKAWLPRCMSAGAPPEHKERAQDAVDEAIVKLDPEKPDERKQLEALLAYQPPVFDPRFYNGAPPGLAVPALRGNEEVVLTHLTEEGRLYFQLPGDRPRVTVDRGKGPEPIAMRLDTLWMDVEERSLVLTWRGHLAYTGPDELATYPFLVVDVEDWKLTDYVDKLSTVPKDEQIGYLGSDTMILDVASLEALRKVDEEEARVRASAEVAAQAAPEGPRYLWTIEDDEGTRREDLVRDRDVLHSDDAWIEALRGGHAVTEDDEQAAAEAALRAGRKKKKEELQKKLEELRKREEEEAAKAKKK